jgi:hypothetical protein
MRLGSFVYGLIAIVTFGASGACATPLAPEICENLRGEILALEQGGLRATITRGPETAKSTLTTEQLGYIRRLIDLDAQLKFRCPSDRAAALLKNVAPEDNPDAPGYSSETDVGGPGAAAPGKAKQAPPKAARPKVEGAPSQVTPPPATSSDAATPSAKPTPRAKPLAKPVAKTDDSYRPPTSGDTNGTPLQKQSPVKTIQQ